MTIEVMRDKIDITAGTKEIKDSFELEGDTPSKPWSIRKDVVEGTIRKRSNEAPGAKS